MNLLLSMLLGSLVMAAPQVKNTKAPKTVSSFECSFVKWPYQDRAINKENINILKKLDRKLVRSYYLNEISTSPVRKELASGLYHYLISTEPNENIRAFLEITSYGAGLSTSETKSLNRTEICEYAKHVAVDLPEN
jgi:hypothetical protein